MIKMILGTLMCAIGAAYVVAIVAAVVGVVVGADFKVRREEEKK